MSMADRRAELFTDVIAHVGKQLRDLGIDAQRADQIGHALADHLAEHWGGQVISIPVEHAIKLSVRDRQILSDRAEGMSIAQLSAKWKLTDSALRYLFRRWAKRDLVDAQQDLFGAPSRD